MALGGKTGKRGKLLINLIENHEKSLQNEVAVEKLRNIDVNSLTYFEPRPYETAGCDLRKINIEYLKYTLFGDKVSDLSTTSKPVAHISPIKRNNSQNANEVKEELSTTALLRGSVSNQNNFKMTLRNHNRNVTSKNISNSPNETLETISNSPDEPFLDSGSSYAPSNTSFISDKTEPELSDSISVQSDNTLENNTLSKGLIENLKENFDIQSYELQKENIEPVSPLLPLQKVITISQSDNQYKIEENVKPSSTTEIRTNKITIGVARKISGRRIRDKEHACYFCQKLICNNLARHMELKHGNDTEVSKILAKPKKSRERRDAFSNLIRYGDFYHNCDVLATKSGNLILARRPSPEEEQFSTYCDYGPCPECLGFLYKKHIWHHLKHKCKSNLKTKLECEEECSRKGPMSESTALLNGILGVSVTPEFLAIVGQFRNDKISTRCTEDETIMRYGAFLFEKYNSTQSELIRQCMRQMGRLSLELRQQGCVFQHLKEVLVPEKFDEIVNATKALCKTSQEDSTKRPNFLIPSLALKIGYGIKKCAAIERGQSLRKGDLLANKKYLGFLQLLDLEWSVRISSNALSTMYTRKTIAEDLLPITSDLLKLNKFLDSEIRNIKQNLCQQTYYKLASLTLARIMMFNKRRSGETAKMTLNQYWSKPNWQDTGTQELRQSLTPLENKLASSLTVIRIVGKRGRIVPIILTNDMKESIELLIKKRVDYGIISNNPYIFALANTSMSHLRGHDCLRKWCIEANLESPDLVTSTKLRKYVATVCQIFNLTGNEQDWLARHLGHDIHVHREFYRLQENAIELTKVSRLLLAVDQGEAHKFKGKELKDINIQDMPILEEIAITDESENEESVNLQMSNEPSDESVPVSKGKKRLTHSNISLQNTKKKSLKRPWTDIEKNILLSKFKSFIKKKSLPGKQHCTELMKNHEVFSERKWTDLKYFIKNHLTKINKITSIS